MASALELPAPLERELEESAKRIGVEYEDQATLLLYVAAALLQGERTSPFGAAVQDFMAEHALDPEVVGSVLQDLLDLCADEADRLGQRRAGTPDGADRRYSNLRAWRNADVHRPRHHPSSRQPAAERPSAFGKYAHLGWSSEEYAREKQAELDREGGARP
jgi:hypothetical protein